MKITIKKNPRTEVFIIDDKKTKPFIFNNSNILMDGILRDVLFKHHLTPERRTSKISSLHKLDEESSYEVPNHDIHYIKSLLIDSLKR